MKFQLTFKTPDVMDQIIDQCDKPNESYKAVKTAEKFVKWDEYLTVEFDTETNTATVLPVR